MFVLLVVGYSEALWAGGFLFQLLVGIVRDLAYLGSTQLDPVLGGLEQPGPSGYSPRDDAVSS